MGSTANKYQLTGRVSFHGNGGYTSVQFWVGGPQLRELRTESIPPELRRVGTWLLVEIPGFKVLGLGEHQDWPWDEPVPRTHLLGPTASGGSWYSFEHGATLGKAGPEDGLITSDEEHSDGARITLERPTTDAPFAITCGIYGWFLHTCFVGTENQARVQYDAMKIGLTEILGLLKASPSEADQASVSATTAIEHFVKKFP